MYSDFRIEPRSPYLALLGDIGNAHDHRLLDFLEQQLRQFKIVFYVLGNHEPYNGTLGDAISRIEDFEVSVSARRRKANAEQQHPGAGAAPSIGQFVLLNRRRFDICDAVSVLGCTLFSNIAASQRGTVSLFVSDFSAISGWTVDAHNAAHRADLEWLNNQVESISRDEPRRTIVILTHHSPTCLPNANDPEHLEDSRGVSTAFTTDLACETCWTSSSVGVWAFGHTHYNCDFVDSATGKRVVANQRGYGRDDDIFDFDGDKTISLSLRHARLSSQHSV